ncbi:MAG: hypothetical protein ACKVRP_02405 [Bacteroidota bacterium]
MSRKIIREELLKANTELGVSIDLLNASSVPQTKRKLRTVHRRTRRVLNLLQRRSPKGKGKSPHPQADGVILAVAAKNNTVTGHTIDLPGIAAKIKSGKLSYGGIARALGLSTKQRADVYHVVKGRRTGGRVYELFYVWANQSGYVEEKHS